MTDQTAQIKEEVVARLWQALAEIDDPEIPVSLVDMGLIVSVDYNVEARTARLRVTFTAMGCPAIDFIQEDIRERLLREPARPTQVDARQSRRERDARRALEPQVVVHARDRVAADRRRWRERHGPWTLT